LFAKKLLLISASLKTAKWANKPGPLFTCNYDTGGYSKTVFTKMYGRFRRLKKCMQFYYISHHILMFFAQALGIKITVNLSSNVQSFM